MTTPEELDRDPMYDRAVGLLVQTNKASTAFLQRRLGLGYNAAARLMERAEADGIVSRPNDVGKRDVLISVARVAELEAHLSEREAMHRRAQKAEGLLDRTMFILDGILKTYIYPETSLSLIKAIEAAHESARESSGRVFQMSHDFQRRNVREAEARATAAEAELARLRQGVQVKPLTEATVERLRHDLQFIVDTIVKDKVEVSEAYPRLFAVLQQRRAEIGNLGGVQVFGEIARDLLQLMDGDHRADLVSPGDGWRSMDSAPKDGRRFWAYEARRGCYECWWQNDLTEWEGWQDDWDSEPEPTAWMPLPAPPTSEGGS